MPEIGIERLGAGDRQEHRPQGDEPDLPVPGEKDEAVHRVQRAQDFQIVEDVHGAGQADGEKPQRDDRAEQGGDLGGSPRLDGEQPYQNCDSQRQNDQ